MIRYDTLDLRILDALQDDLVIVPEPWKLIADRIGISEEECLMRISHLKDAGIIRTISPVLDSRRFGLSAGSLIALSVPEEQIGDVVAVINSYPEVSHNYQRDHHYNIWFTVSARNEEEIERICNEIRSQTEIPKVDLIALPTIRSYKIDVRFSCYSREEHESER
jgi:DNA-binding Lrp family transcriptional regulator